ncbi:hypothetical protein LH464_04905 [Neorhizobium sp. T786]|uniref:hypothetical protein n=1 Tax=Pseudorhizobium xiangyangii TaxID=2883104 RepID=UPI001CFF9B26|nr:hypothetical protein [Neorhizobium xiangyangii]MCB5201816.1 hypothetical protein [Neorhizobium xiangyangii]
MNTDQKATEHHFDIIRAEMDAGLRRLQAAGATVEDVASQLVKVGVALSLAGIGPTATLRGLFAQAQQLREEFPEEAIAADRLNKLACLPVEGSA